MRLFHGALVKDSAQRCELLSTQEWQMLCACLVVSGLPLLETRCWTSWVLADPAQMFLQW